MLSGTQECRRAVGVEEDRWMSALVERLWASNARGAGDDGGAILNSSLEHEK